MQRESVLVFTRDAVALRHHVGGVDHFHEQRRLVLDQPGVEVRCAAAAGGVHQRNAFHATRHHGGHAFEHDAPGGHGNGLQARRAEAVDDRAAHGDGQACAQRRLAANVAAGGALGVAAAPDQVFDQAGVNACALHGSLHREGTQLGARGLVEFAAVRLGQRGTGGGNDDGFAHGGLLGV